MTGKLYAIGLGPGDPELITVKGQRLLNEVDAIYLPVREGHSSVSRRIIEQQLDASKTHELPFKMSRNPEENRERWRQHADTLSQAVRDGRTIAFVTEGDPLLYSTFVHVYREMLKSDPDVSVEIVPGISSITAAAAIARRPISQESERVAIVPATGEVLHALATFDSVIVLKVSAALNAVLKALDVTGRTSEAIYVERAGWPQQRVVADVETLAKQKLDYFGLMIVTR